MFGTSRMAALNPSVLPTELDGDKTLAIIIITAS